MLMKNQPVKVCSASGEGPRPVPSLASRVAHIVPKRYATQASSACLAAGDHIRRSRTHTWKTTDAPPESPVSSNAFPITRPGPPRRSPGTKKTVTSGGCQVASKQDTLGPRLPPTTFRSPAPSPFPRHSLASFIGGSWGRDEDFESDAASGRGTASAQRRAACGLRHRWGDAARRPRAERCSALRFGWGSAARCSPR
jgi:hypothetical protein